MVSYNAQGKDSGERFFFLDRKLVFFYARGMKKIIFLEMFLLLCSPLVEKAEAQTFSRGDHFVAIPLRGQVVASCPQQRPGFPGGGPSLVSYSCRDLVLEPSERDYFLGPQGVGAETVHLQVVHADGSTREKDYSYDSATFRTKKLVNLWLASLFQKPLLEEGLNQFKYVLKNGDQAIREGRFEVQVDRGAARTCPRSSLTIWDPNECSNQVSVCRRYFQQFDNCK